MNFLTTQDLLTTIYEEELTAITRSNPTIAQSALDAAEEEVKSYLMKDYDTDIIFSKMLNARSALLVTVCKDIAVWRLIALSNPSIYYEDREKRYEQAIDWLKAVARGTIQTALPKKTIDPATGNSRWGSNIKKEQHY